MSAHPFPTYFVDASGFIFRAFHALPPLLNPHGQPVGAVYGFLSMLLTLLKEHQPQTLGIVFDTGRPTFRHTLYQAYKANRLAPAPELVSQFALVREACHSFGLPVLEKSGFEADDVLASYAHHLAKDGHGITLVSSDKDLMQLVEPHVRVWDPLKRCEILEAQVLEKFGVKPCQVADVQALTGDPSDNVPGVQGIGIKTAQLLIKEFHSLDQLYDNIDHVTPPRRQELLRAGREQAFLSRTLVTLDQEVPLPVSPDLLTFQGITVPSAREFLNTHGFKTLAARLPKDLETSSPFQESEKSLASAELKASNLNHNLGRNLEDGLYPSPNLKDQPEACTFIQTQEDLVRWVERGYTTGTLAFHLQTTPTSPFTVDVDGIGLATSPGRLAYIPLKHTLSSSSSLLSLQTALESLRGILTDTCVMKIGHNLKFTSRVFHAHGIAVTPVDDILLLSYVLHGGQHAHTVDVLAQTYLPELPFSLSNSPESAGIILRLWTLFAPQIQTKRLNRIYQWVERPLSNVLLDLETRGVRVDLEKLHSLSFSMGQTLAVLSEKIYGLAGQTFNLASPKQLGHVLFDSLGLTAGKKTKTGAYGTNSQILETLAAQGHDIATYILQWRATAKLKSTYADALAQQLNPDTHRLHTSFLMAATSTGRLASSDPNLQNIPIRTPEGREIRRAFIPSEGMVMASFDYSQIELRLLAHMGKVEPLLEAFRKGVDVHQETASQVFGVPLAQVDRELRRKAKAINFGIIYGMSAYGLAERLEFTPGEAAHYIKAYLAHYAGIEAYMERTKAFARTHGYVETLWGRRCYVGGIGASNPALRQASERQAINAPLQGTAADLIKRAMIHVHDFLAQEQTSLKMLLQIHDELLFEGPEEEITRLAPRICSLMGAVASLDVPLNVAWGMGPTWEDAH